MKLDQIKTTISSLESEEPTTYGELSVFPLTSKHTSSLRYLLLGDGLQKNLVKIEEVSESGSVPELVVKNYADLPVLIVDGEELAGAKQNRIANLTMLIAANQETKIPVSCVESGRWHYRRETVSSMDDHGGSEERRQAQSRRKTDFDTTDYISTVRGRSENLADVRESMRRGHRRSNQGRVWDSLAEEMRNLDASSPTGAMHAMFDRHRKTLNDYVESVQAVPTQVGAVFVVKNRCCGLDLFDQPETFAALLPKLVRSYAIDALRNSPRDQEKSLEYDSQAFLDRILDGSFDDHPAVGLGRDVGITGEKLVGGALVADDTVVHLTAFAAPQG